MGEGDTVGYGEDESGEGVLWRDITELSQGMSERNEMREWSPPCKKGGGGGLFTDLVSVISCLIEISNPLVHQCDDAVTRVARCASNVTVEWQRMAANVK
jgi:hypothetical protein